MKLIGISILTLLTIQSVHGQRSTEDCEICKTALLKDVISTRSSNQARLYQLDIIDEKNFNQLRRSADMTLLLPNFAMDGNYQEFSDKRRAYFKLMNFVSDKANSYEQVKIISSERSYDSFDLCIKDCFASQSKDNLATIVLYKIKDTKTSVVIRCRYIGNDFAYGTAKVKLEARVGLFLDNSKTKEIPIDKNDFKDFEILRNNNEVEIEAYVNGNLYDNISSKFEAPEENKKVEVSCYYSKRTTKDVRKKTDFWVSKTTWDMHEVRSEDCGCEVCNASLGKWCHGNYELSYPYNSSDHYLDNCKNCYYGDVVKKDCEGGGCGWSQAVFDQSFRFKKSSDGRSFTINFTSGSHSSKYTFYISVFEKVTEDIEYPGECNIIRNVITVSVPQNGLKPYMLVGRNGLKRNIDLTNLKTGSVITIGDLKLSYNSSFYESGKTTYQFKAN